MIQTVVSGSGLDRVLVTQIAHVIPHPVEAVSEIDRRR